VAHTLPDNARQRKEFMARRTALDGRYPRLASSF